MAITVKYLEGLGIEKDVAKQIFAERSNEIEADKAERERLETELNKSKTSIESLNAEFEKLKQANADGAEWKAKFETLQSETKAKEEKAEADRILNEKNASIERRFDVVVGDKKFYNEPTRNYYLKKFGEALESKDYEGKGDSDIFHSLTKDDNTAFKGVTAVKLAGGTPRGNGKYSSRAEIMAIKDTATRLNEMVNNPQYFPELNTDNV